MAKREFVPKVIRHPRIPLSEDEIRARSANLVPAQKIQRTV